MADLGRGKVGGGCRGKGDLSVGLGGGIDRLGGIDGLGMAVSLLGLRGVDGGTLVGNISDEASLMVSVVGDSLDTAVGKVDTVRALNNTVVILGLALLEAGAGVVILDTILVSEGLRGGASRPCSEERGPCRGPGRKPWEGHTGPGQRAWRWPRRRGRRWQQRPN